MSEDGGSSLVLLSSKNANHHGNLNESDSKRQKVTSDAESNDERVELFTTEKNPLQIDVVLKNLVKYVGEKQLFSCRLVSPQWNKIATSSLKQRYYFIKFFYVSNENIFKKSLSTSTTLSQLNNILSTSKDFPVANFRFDRGNLASFESTKFFKTHGEKIKRLYLSLKPNGTADVSHTSITGFRRVLLEDAKNVEELRLDDIPEEWCKESSIQLFPEPRNMIQLPKLTLLSLVKYSFRNEKSYKLVQDLIQAAVNLKTIDGYKIEFLDPSASAFENKVHAVNNIYFEPTRENLELYSKFAEGGPKLETLKICLDILNNDNNNDFQLRKKVIETFQKILESSKDTLKYMLNLPPLSHLPALKISSMKKVIYLTFTDHEERTVFNWIEDFQGIPRPVHLSQIFPSLKSITTEFQSPKDTELWLNFFDYSQPLHSVKDLEVQYESCPRFVRKLATLFPAVEELKVHINLADFRQTMSVIWKGFSGVKHLTVELVKYPDDEILVEEMDSGITGFSPETCLQLKNNLKNMKLEDVEALRENPSICDVTNLSSFEIQFQFEEDEDHEDHEEVFSGPIFSAVTGIFGFDFVKKRNGVKVAFTVEDSTDCNLDLALSEIVHYVNDKE